MKLLRYFYVAIESIMAHKMRAGLTMLGIIIGVAAVLTTMGIGSGAAASITGQIESQGTNLLTVSANSNRTLTLGDFAVLANSNAHPELAMVAPEYTASAQITRGSAESQNQVVGATPAYAIVRNLEIEQGRFLNEEEVETNRSVVVLGATVATTLFGNADPLGQIVRIAGEPFTVIGVLAKAGSAGFGSSDNQTYVPIGAAQGRLFNAPRYRGDYTLTGISIQVADRNRVDAAERQVEQILRLRHGLGAGDDNDFTIFNQASLLEVANSVTATLTVFLGSIAAVSLLVGGIGIMNIMLVSVTERTKEIGLRRAVGAHDSDILLQFLVEALVICTLGGAIGMSLSFGLGFLVGQIPGFPFQVIIQPQALMLALGVSMGSGFIFGLYPALRATRLDPIEALRYE